VGIRVFKLNWIEQRNLEFAVQWIEQRSLEFDVHEVHSGKNKGTAGDRYRQTLGAVNNGYIDTPERDCTFDSMSKLSTVVAQSVDRLTQAVDRCSSQSESWVSSVCRHATL